MVDPIEATGRDPIVDRVLGFDQFSEAFKHLVAGRHFGKIGIDFALGA